MLTIKMGLNIFFPFEVFLSLTITVYKLFVFYCSNGLP